MARQLSSTVSVQTVDSYNTKLDSIDSHQRENEKKDLQNYPSGLSLESSPSTDDPKHKHNADLGDETMPDGGVRAWLVVLGSFCAIVTTFGMSNGLGTIENYLKTHQLSDHTTSGIGWISSLWIFFMYIGGVQSGPVFDAYGLRPLIVPGYIGWIASVMLTSVCKEYYQFILAFSILGGISTSMIFNPAITVLGHWFRRKRALVTGIACGGGALGGIFIPLMLNKLFEQIGYGWAIRVLGFIYLALGLVAISTLKSRHSPREVDWREALIDVKSLVNKDFASCCVGVFLCEWAVLVPINYMVIYASAQGLSDSYANSLQAYMNIGSLFGRTIPGYLADIWGVYNVTVFTSIVTAIVCLAVWIPAGHTKAGVTAFTVLFGFWSGSTISLTPVCVTAISATKDHGKRYGTAYSLASIAVLTGIPLAGALTDNNFLGMKIFAGVVYLASGITFLLARWFAVGKKLVF